MRKLLVLIFFVALLLPCGVFARTTKSAEVITLSKRQRELHILNRLTFGANEESLRLISQIGIERFIEMQLNPDSINDYQLDSAIAKYEVLNLSTDEIFKKYPNPAGLLRASMRSNNPGSDADRNLSRQNRREMLQKIYKQYNLRPAGQIMQQVQSARINRAAYSKKQLEEVMVDFWSNHFNVYSRKAATRWFIPSYERDVIRKHALGNFRDLLVGTAQHPAMLFYLDNYQSYAPAKNNNQNRLLKSIVNGKLDPRIRNRLKKRGLTDQEIDRRIEQAKRAANNQNQRGINENYARELLELHTLGVDGGYTQNDIKEVARAFTGWTIYDPRGYRRAAARELIGTEDQQLKRQARRFKIPANSPSGTFVFVNSLHDNEAKTILGKRINKGGIDDGIAVLDMLVEHPATANFIARKLAVKFVSDNPNEAFVDRIAKAFHDSDGDIKTTLMAIFNDPEFFAAENYRAKIKTPFELMASSIRALDAQTSAGAPMVAMLTQMGEPLYGYQAPTGYPDTAADWVNTGALLGRMNFAVALASNRIPRTKVNLNQFSGTTKNETLEIAIEKILHNEVSTNTKSILGRQLNQPLPDATLTVADQDDLENLDSEMPQMQNRQNRRNRLNPPSGNPDVFKIVSLVLGSPEFQRQ